MATIAIGDIHGCARALHALIAAIDPGPEDVLVSLGDYIDRGPESREVVDQLLALETTCHLVPLLGNHEIMLLQALHDAAARGFWLQYGGRETLDSYQGSLDHIPHAHLDFFHRCRRFHETAKHVFLHANYDADLSLDEQPDYLLFWEHVNHQCPPARHCSGKTVVVGHTPQPGGEILDLGHLICIDTYCFGHGWLTALDVETGQLWQAEKEGRLRDW